MTVCARPPRKVRTPLSKKHASRNKKAAAKCRHKVAAGSDANSNVEVPTFAPDNQTTRPPKKAPNNRESHSTNLAVGAPQKFDGMEVHRKSWHCLYLFQPPYVCGQCHKAVYLWCMHCEGCGFCLPTLVCPVRGRAHPDTDKWLFQKWCQEVDIEEVLTTTLPKQPVSNDEEMDLLSNPLLASPLGKEVRKKEVPPSFRGCWITGFFFGCSPHPNGSKFCRLCVEHR